MRENLKAERKLSNNTQEEVAASLGITARQYRAIEAGASDGSMKVWQKLKRLFGKPIDYLTEKTVFKKGRD